MTGIWLVRTALLAVVSATALNACGVKSDLVRPAGPVLQEESRDPSKPPVPLGEPGGNIPPYSTGP